MRIASSALGARVSSAVIGVVAAIVTVVVVDQWRKPPQVGLAPRPSPLPRTSDAKSTDGTQIVRTVFVDRTDDEKLAELQQQVKELRDAREAEEQKRNEPWVRRDPEEARRALEAMFSELDRQFSSDPPDATWSPGAQKDLAGGLGDMGREFNFRVGAAECKTMTCRATVAFSDYESAVKAGRELAERTFPGLNCAQKVWLKPPEDPSAPYSTNLYLDCSEQRAGLVEAVSSR